MNERIELDAGGPERVPGILQIPPGATPRPAALLLHGFSSDKERLAHSIGSSLARRGVASLAIDLPLHGARLGSYRDLSLENPLGVLRAWRLALREAEVALRYLIRRTEIDAKCLGIAGYSLGAYMSVFVAGSALVRAVVLVAGGDLPEFTPFERIVRAAADPRRAVKKLRGRPLLMINGRNDRTIRPAQATALFDAAREPKEQRWYDGGHWPPPRMIDEAAEWLAHRLQHPHAEQFVRGA